MIYLSNQIPNINSKIAKHWSKYGWLPSGPWATIVCEGRDMAPTTINQRRKDDEKNCDACGGVLFHRGAVCLCGGSQG
jgi:hypothetical protein